MIKSDYIILSVSNQSLIMNGKLYHAISGPFGRGTLPSGEYIMGDLCVLNSEDCDEGFVFRNKLKDLAFWIKLTPNFKTDRDGLGIHPDGNTKGALGCVGIQDIDSINFYLDYMDILNRPKRLIVVP